jgi:hypothetical protein
MTIYRAHIFGEVIYLRFRKIYPGFLTNITIKSRGQLTDNITIVLHLQIKTNTFSYQAI